MLRVQTTLLLQLSEQSGTMNVELVFSRHTAPEAMQQLQVQVLCPSKEGEKERRRKCGECDDRVRVWSGGKGVTDLCGNELDKRQDDNDKGNDGKWTHLSFVSFLLFSVSSSPSLF